MGRMSRSKGARGERELAGELASLFRVECERTAQRCGKGGTADVRFVDGAEQPLPLRIHWESKRTERLNLYAALDQATEDAAEGHKPVVCHRKNNREWVAVIRLSDLPHVVTQLFHLLHSNP